MSFSDDTVPTRSELETLYLLHFNELTEHVSSNFGLTGDQAEELVHDVLIATVRRTISGESGRNELRAWLRGAIACAAGRLGEAKS